MESPPSRLAPHSSPISSSASSGVGAATAHVDGGIGAPTSVDSSVHGWLMSVPGYGGSNTACSTSSEEVDSKNNRLLFEERRRSHRSASISSLGSTDSANLDDLIRNNCVAQVDDETDLPDLADLDLDDSADDFWKMNDILANGHPMNPSTTLSADRDHELLSINTPLDEQELVKMAAGDDKLLSWSPEAGQVTTTAHNKLMSSKLRVTSSGYGIPSPGHRFGRQRSSSLSSENSLTSESTVTTSGNTSQYAHYGMTPVLYPSESTSASNTSRSPSRLSDYSATSSQTSHTSAIPRPQSRSYAASSSSSSHNTTTTNTRRLSDKLSSDTLRSSSRIASGSRINSNQSRLAKRATHVPLPSTRTTPPTVIATTSRSTGLSDTTRVSAAASSGNNNNNNRPGSRVGGRRLRSSHIPSPHHHTRNVASPEPPSSPDSCLPTRGGGYRPMSPSYAGSSRIGGIRSPTPTNGNKHRVVNNNNNNNNKKEESRIGRPASAVVSGISRLAKPKRTA